MNRKCEKSVLIIGGGVAGMSAAKVLDSQGINVHLVEKQDHLGGRAFDWACMATDKCRYCGACLSPELVEQTHQLEHATIYRECRINSLDKNEDGYHVSVKGSIETEFNVRAVILATGFEPFNPDDLKFFEYDKKGVITTAELNNILKKESLSAALNNNDSPSIAFIQCVGSRNREIGLDYCSEVCCKTAVRHANKIVHLIPDASVTIFHMDLQICGKMFRTQVDQLGNRAQFIQGIPGKALVLEDGKIRLIQEDINTGARTAFDFDMVVLAVGMRPGNDNSKIAGILNLDQDRWGFVNNDREAADKKIYSIGSVRGPIDIVTAMEQGVSAAHRLLCDLEGPEAIVKKEVAVFGNGNEGQIISRAMADAGHIVHLFDRGAESEDYEGITVYPESMITGISGTAGNYIVSAESENKRYSVQVSSIIVASGSRKTALSDEELFPESDSIISLAEFRKSPEDPGIANADNVVFWLDHAGHEWKENARETLFSALETAKAGKSVSIIMEKMLVNGLHGQELYDSARNQSVKFLRVTSPSDVTIKAAGNRINVVVNEATLAGVALEVPCDLLVIPEKISPDPQNSVLAGILRQETDNEGQHQHPNPRHRLVGSTRRGIFYAGSCHDETDKHDLDHEIRIINTLIKLMPGIDIRKESCAEIDEGKCARCLTCFRVCPHGAIILENQQQPLIIDDACFGCGLCITCCPATAISRKGPDKLLEKSNPEIDVVIFACKRSAILAEKEYQRKGNKTGSRYRIIPIDCACSLDSREVMDQLLDGANRIIVLTCHPENCRSMHGDLSARLKLAKILTDTEMPESMLTLQSIAANEPVKFGQFIDATNTEQKENSDE